MKFHDAAISLQPRNIGSCLDLALVFVGQNLGMFLQIFAIIAGPTCAAIYWGARVTSYGWLWSLIGVGAMSIPLGTALVFAAARIALGQRCSAFGAILGAFRSAFTAMTLTLVLRPVHFILTLAGGLPGVALLLYTGFHAEARIFSTWRAGEHDHRVSDLVKTEFSDLIARGIGVGIFGLGFWGLLTITVDAACMLLVGVSPCLGRMIEATRNPWGLEDWEAWWSALLAFITTDALALTTVCATALATYAVCRLAWIFAYVDLRIRRDCWDVEVALSEEARRWRTVA